MILMHLLWMQEYGIDNMTVTEEDMLLHSQEVHEDHGIVQPTQSLEMQIDAGLLNVTQKPLMWTVDEELVVVTEAPSAGVQPSGWSKFGRTVAFLAASVCASLALRQVMGSATSSKYDKHSLPFAHKEHIF